MYTAQVVNAVFVQQTMKTASSDDEIAFKQKQKDVDTYTRSVSESTKDEHCLVDISFCSTYPKWTYPHLGALQRDGFLGYVTCITHV